MSPLASQSALTSNEPAIDNKPTADACAQHCTEDDIVAFTGAFNRFCQRQTIGIIGRDDPALKSLSSSRLSL